jgi:CBS domain-containing protein
MKEFKSTLVRDVMHRDVRTTIPRTPLSQAAKEMGADDLTCLVVDTEDPARGFGILTQKDLVCAMADVGDLEGLFVEDFMTHPTLGLEPGWNVETALALMRMMGLRRAPVVENGALIGILSYTDIFRKGLALLEAAD